MGALLERDTGRRASVGSRPSEETTEARIDGGTARESEAVGTETSAD
ncbi:hypothetical protein [Natronococcus jeotgali]|nr:hypothetical protein [Natronococcus jeotgali]